MTLLRVLVLCLLPVTCFAQTQTHVIRIKDWGRGMTPNLNHTLANDPSNVIKSQNFYAHQAGGRQLRHGYTELLDSVTAHAVMGNGGVDAIATFHPADHKRWLTFAINGHWGYGNLDTTATKLKAAMIAPALTSPSILQRLEWADDSAWYSNPPILVSVTDTVDAATTTHIVAIGLTQDDDFWNGGICSLFANSACPGSTVVITDFKKFGDTLFFDAFSCTPTVGDSFSVTLYGTANSEFIPHIQPGDSIAMGFPTVNDFTREVRWVIDNRKVVFTDTVPTVEDQVTTTLDTAGTTWLISSVLTESESYWIDARCSLTTGVFADTVRVVTGFNAAADSVSFAALSGTPADGDDFVITLNYTDSGFYAISRSYPNDSAITPYMTQFGDNLYTGTKRSRPQIIYPRTPTVLGIRELAIADSVTVDDIHFKFGTDSTIVRSWDSSSTAREFIYTIQVVDHSQDWTFNQWSEQAANVGESFYFRFGSRGGVPDRYGRGDGDTLDAMTYQILGNTDSSLFLAAIFLDPIDDTVNADTSCYELADTLLFDGFVGGTGYVFSSAGDFSTAHEGSDSLVLYAGGALMVTNDSLPADSLSGVGGMYFVRALSSTPIPVETFRRWNYEMFWVPCGTQFNPPANGVILWGPQYDWSQGFCQWGYMVRWPLRNVKEQVYFDKTTYFPIMDIEHKRDSMFIRTGKTFDPGGSPVTIGDWEIVRVAMPYWENVVPFRKQLHAFGDTTNPGTINRSKADVAGAMGVWAWSATDDVVLGDNPSDPLKALMSYDDQLLAGTQENIYSTVDGLLFKEITRNIGVVGPWAMFPHNKEFYFLADEGPYGGARRDLAGHSVTFIGDGLEPIWNDWNATEYGLNVVPFRINPALRDLSILIMNQREQRLYLFFAEGASTTLNRCATYSLKTNQWDGLLTIPVGAAISARFSDTTSIVFGSATGPVIYRLDYALSDNGAGIDGEILFAPFCIRDEQGRPIESALEKLWMQYRSSSASIDTAWVEIIGDNLTTTAVLTPSSSIQGYTEKTWSGSNRSVFWQIKVYVEGADVDADLFTPEDLIVEFSSERSDNR